jgi:hypothetical protein
MTNGTQAIIIPNGASAPDPIDKRSFTSNTDSRLNSAYWIDGKWENCIASDDNGSKCMLWVDANDNTLGMLVYSTATVWGWDYGYTPGGHPTVFTNKFSAKLSNNNRVLTIYDKAGNVFATYKGTK